MSHEKLIIPGERSYAASQLADMARSMEEWWRDLPNPEKPFMYVGARGFTVAQLAEEVRNGTRLGMGLAESACNMPGAIQAEKQQPISRQRQVEILRERMAEARGSLDALHTCTEGSPDSSDRSAMERLVGLYEQLPARVREQARSLLETFRPPAEGSQEQSR